MTNFDAKVYTNYDDIDGLVLHCHHSGLANGNDADWPNGSRWLNTAPYQGPQYSGTHNGSNNASVLSDGTANWFSGALIGKFVFNVTDGSNGRITANTATTVTATLANGTDNDWDTNDSYLIAVPRFGNPYQTTAANRPVVSTVSSVQRATFTRASSHYMMVPLDVTTIPTTDWTIAYVMVAGSSTTNQYILDSTNFSIYRQDGSGNKGYRYNSTHQTDTGDMGSGAWLLVFDTTSTADFYTDGTTTYSGTAANIIMPESDTAALYIGTDITTTHFFDGALTTLMIWNKKVSPLEIDFAFDTFDPSAAHAQETYATMSVPAWTDNTTVAANDVSRVNPTIHAQPRFVKAVNGSVGTWARVQIAGIVDGLVRPDSELGGDLFTLEPVEIPSVEPWQYQSSGWSSIFDLRVRYEGHYTYKLTRASGGSVFVHFDVENT